MSDHNRHICQCVKGSHYTLKLVAPNVKEGVSFLSHQEKDILPHVINLCPANATSAFYKHVATLEMNIDKS